MKINFNGNTANLNETFYLTEEQAERIEKQYCKLMELFKKNNRITEQDVFKIIFNDFDIQEAAYLMAKCFIAASKLGNELYEKMEEMRDVLKKMRMEIKTESKEILNSNTHKINDIPI
jgi:phosphomevalonate kinase